MDMCLDVLWACAMDMCTDMCIVCIHMLIDKGMICA